jgi:tetratricopeptide (TPR) repeat protein
MAQIGLGDNHLALEAAERASSLEPEDELGHILRSAALYNLGRFGESIAAAREAVALAPYSWMTYQRLAEAVVASDQLPYEALSAAQRAVELAPDEAQAHGTLGAAHEKGGNHAEAERCFRRALALDPESADAHEGLARVHWRPDGGNFQFFNPRKLAAAATGFRDAVGVDPRGGGTAAGNVEIAIRSFVDITTFLVTWAVWFSALVIRFSAHHSIVGRVLPPVLLLAPSAYAVYFFVSAPPDLRRRARYVAFHRPWVLISSGFAISVVLLLVGAARPWTSDQRAGFTVLALLAYAVAVLAKREMRRDGRI